MRRPYPVHYTIAMPGTFSRLQLLVRIVVFAALGLLGLSFGLAFAIGYLMLPAYAASRLSTREGDPGSYIPEDGPRVLGVLSWFAALSAWCGLVADRVPDRSADETVTLAIDGTTDPTPRSALLRVVTGIPSALVLAFLCWFGVFVWLWAALTILVAERVGPGAFHYLTGLQRWSVRLLAYQASLVDDYPPFSFTDVPTALPTARATT